MKYKFVFIDVDGVLRDFVVKMREIFTRDFPDEKILREDLYDLRNWSTLGDKIFPWVTDGASAKEMFLDSYPFGKSLDTLKKWLSLTQNDVQFAIITRQIGDRIEWTREWLEKHGIDGKIPVHYTTDKVAVMKNIIPSARGKSPEIPFSQAVLLDDSPHELDEALKAGAGAVCVDRTWNRGWKGRRIKDLSEFDPFQE